MEEEVHRGVEDSVRASVPRVEEMSGFRAEAERLRVMARQYGSFGLAGYSAHHRHAEQQVDDAIEAALTAAWNGRGEADICPACKGVGCVSLPIRGGLTQCDVCGGSGSKNAEAIRRLRIEDE